MYNIIAYISFFIAYMAVFIGIGSFFLYSLESNEILILSAVILGFGQIYDKVKTKPISQAIKDYWKAKTNKNNDDLQTYDEYKSKKK